MRFLLIITIKIVNIPTRKVKIFRIRNISLTFTDGEQRVFDVKPLLSMSAFKQLKNKNLFESVRVSYGSIQWPHDIDYCPDTLYAESMTVEEWDPDWAKITQSERAELEAGRAEIARGEYVRPEDINRD